MHKSRKTTCASSLAYKSVLCDLYVATSNSESTDELALRVVKMYVATSNSESTDELALRVVKMYVATSNSESQIQPIG